MMAMRRGRGLLILCLAGVLGPAAQAETFFEACQGRFFQSMDCINEACGDRGVLDLPPAQFCEPRACDEFLNANTPTSGLEYSWCKEDYVAAGGRLDAAGRPVPDCTPNPAFAPANERADRFLACQEGVWRQCGGDFIDRYKVGGGMDLMKCKADFDQGQLPPR